MARQANALELLKHDHREVQQLFRRFEEARNERDQDKLCSEMVDALKTHTRIEEEVFYPFIRQTTDCLDLVEEANVEHSTAKQLIDDLENGRRDGVHRHAVVKVLSEYVGHHIREEEDRIFPVVEKTGVDLDALGRELMEHKKGSKGNVMQQASGAQGSAAQGGEAAGFAAQAHSREEDEAYREAVGDELGRSAQRAKWIHQPGEKADHDGQTLATRNPAVIMAWAEERKARPATSPGGDAQNPRVLRFDFPDYDKGLQQVSWEAWCRVFEERGLVFLFQQRMKDGKQSNFFRLDSPNREDA